MVFGPSGAITTQGFVDPEARQWSTRAPTEPLPCGWSALRGSEAAAPDGERSEDDAADGGWAGSRLVVVMIGNVRDAKHGLGCPQGCGSS